MLPALTFPAPAERALFWGKKQSKYRPEPRVPEKGWEPGILQFSSCWDVSLIDDTRLNPCPCLGSWHLWGQNAWWLIGCRYGTEVPVVKGKKKVKNRTCCQHFVGSGVACLTQSVAEKVFFVRGQESEAKASGGCRVQPWGTELLHLHPLVSLQRCRWRPGGGTLLLLCQWGEFAAATQEIHADKLLSWSFYCFFFLLHLRLIRAVKAPESLPLCVESHMRCSCLNSAEPLERDC